MAEPILAIDFGTTASSAALVQDGRSNLLKDPATGLYSWPSSVLLDGDRLLTASTAEARKHSEPARYRTEFKRDLGQRVPVVLGDREFAADELATALLRRLRGEARALAGTEIHRAVVTIPASYTDQQRQDLMVEAGQRAGFTDVDLLSEPVAAALAPVVGSPFVAGDVVLVYDLGGGTFDAALVRVNGGGNGHAVLGHAAEEMCGGHDVDALLVAFLRERVDPELAAALSLPAPGSKPSAATLRAQLSFGDLVRALKQQLSLEEEAEGFLSPIAPPLRLTRAELTGLVEPLLARTVECCRRLLTTAAVEAGGVAGVLLVGGSSRMPQVAEEIRALGRPVHRAEDVDLAVVQGAAVWAAQAHARQLVPWPLAAGQRPLRWRLPGAGTGTLLRWMVRPRQVFGGGAPLALARLHDGALWRLRAGEITGQLVGTHVGAGGRIATGDWLATCGPPEPALRLSCEAEQPGVAFSVDGSRVATVGVDGMVRIWDAVTGRELTGVALDAGESGDSPCAVAFSPDGQRLAVSPHADRAWVVDPSAGTRLAEIQHDDVVMAVAFSPDGRRVATGSRDHTVRISGAASGDKLLSIKIGGSIWPYAAAFSPDGATLAVAWDEGQGARVYRADTGDKLLSLAGAGIVTDLAFSPDGRCLATTDGTARIWDPRTGQALLTLDDDGDVLALAYSSDGSRLATVAEDGSVRVWDATAGAVLLHLADQDDAVSVAFGPDGRLAVGHDGIGVLLWDIVTDHPAEG